MELIILLILVGAVLYAMRSQEDSSDAARAARDSSAARAHWNASRPLVPHPTTSTAAELWSRDEKGGVRGRKRKRAIFRHVLAGGDAAL